MTRVEMLIAVLAVVAFLTAFLVLVVFKKKTSLPKPGGRRVASVYLIWSHAR